MKNPFKRIALLTKLLMQRMQGSLQVAIKDGMKVGEGVTVMKNVSFGSEPYLTTLEDYVRISSNVTFVNHDGGTWAFRDMPEYKGVFKYGRIHIGERSFIGCNTTILPGVTIGKRCVIGAGSVVTKDVPDGCVAAGVPARVIMTTEEYAQKCKQKMKPYDRDAYSRDKKGYLQEYVE